MRLIAEKLDIPAWIPWTTFMVISAGSTKLGSRPYESLLIWDQSMSLQVMRYSHER